MERRTYDHNSLTGNDADIETSLKEYGLAWIETDTEYLFYYGIKMDDNADEYVKFDFRVMDKTLNLTEEFDWVDWEEINNYIGMKFNDLPFAQKVADLLYYYGFENVFGACYWSGLNYNDIVKE